jgi:uncharacterized protein YbjT (DUF2867 family)
LARRVAITGASGYLGKALTVALTERGHHVLAIVRPGGSQRCAIGVRTAELDVFDVDALAGALRGCDAVVHLIGTPHPNPSKAREFQRVDLGSVRACVPACVRANVAHFIYVSVAQPAPVMQAYIDARAEAERVIADAKLAATVIRPWYVLGPGHRWPLVLVPFYLCAELVPSWRESARRLGLVTLRQMVDVLARAVDQPPSSATMHVLGVPEIKAA